MLKMNLDGEVFLKYILERYFKRFFSTNTSLYFDDYYR